MCKKTKLFTDKSFLLLQISLSMSLDDTAPVAWGLLFSDLFVMFLSVWKSVLWQEQPGWVHGAGGAPLPTQLPADHT